MPIDVPMTGAAQIVGTVCSALTSLGVLWIGNEAMKARAREKLRQQQEETRQREIALKVEEVRLAAIMAARKVDEVRVAAEQTAVKVEEVRQETNRTTHRVEDVREALDVTAALQAEKLDKIGEISTDSVKISTEALRRGNGALGRILRQAAELAEWKASHSANDPAASREAELARKDYDEHQAEQAQSPLTEVPAVPVKRPTA